MLIELGYIGLSYSVLSLSLPAIKKANLKRNLRKTFDNAELYKKKGKAKVFPYVLKTDIQEDKTTFVFSIPKGVDPEAFLKKKYVFQQHFTNYIELEVENKRGRLKVYTKGLPTVFNYDYNDIQSVINGLELPIVCGKMLDNAICCFDLVTHPHILISGETGSGKSSEIRSILTTLIQTKSPKELRLVLGDLKRSEFHLFKHLEHVVGVFHSARELYPTLNKVKREMAKRGDILDKAGVNSIGELENPLPYIVVCIDEVVLLKKETEVMDILEEISSIGRSLGVFLILSMQRPDSKLLDGKLKVNLTVRMGFKMPDRINAKIIGTPGAEKIKTPGRMILGINSHLQEIQAPWLKNDEAKKLLAPYKKKKAEVIANDTSIKEDPNKEYAEKDNYNKVVELFNS